MPQALMIVGALLSVLGVAGIAAGAPDWVLGLSLGATLIQSGIIALVGGLALIGVALMLNAMRELLDRIDALTSRRPAIEQRRRPAAPSRPAVRTPGDDATLIGEKPADPIDDAEVRNRRDPGSGYRIEETERAEREQPAEQPESARPRREALSGFASDDQMRVRREAKTRQDEEPAWRPRRETASETSNDDEPRSRSTSPAARREEVARSSRRNVLPMPPPPLPLPLDTRPRPREVTPEIPMPRFRPVETKPPEPAPAETTVVRSGVIGGMAYTLYADGSIEAELPIGTVRFGSIAELQDHVMRTGTEAEVDFKETGR